MLTIALISCPSLLQHHLARPQLSRPAAIVASQAVASPRVAQPPLALAEPALLDSAGELLSFADQSPALLDSVCELLSFADQSGNLAGVLFPASLPPYLLFLYFICQDVNGLSPTAKAGFSSLLCFVTATVVTSIVAVKSYGLTLANVDWLHSGAEQLLSFTNVANVIGLKLTIDSFSAGGGEKRVPGSSEGSPVLPIIGGAAAVTVAATWAAAGGSLGEHSAYLGGLGNLPPGVWMLGFAEPANALSLPTWVIHLSSLLEWLVAMGLVWRLGSVTGNPKWKGLTWAMIPSHSSGVCACVYHLFYNAPSLQFVVTLQALLTLVGNCTLAFAAWRLAESNGWTFALPTFGQSADATDAVDSDAPPAVATPTMATAGSELAGAKAVDASGGDAKGLLVILAWSIVGSYVVKYGETLLPLFAEGLNDADSVAVPVVATLLIVAGSSFNVWKWHQRSQQEAEDFGGLV